MSAVTAPPAPPVAPGATASRGRRGFVHLFLENRAAAAAALLLALLVLMAVFAPLLAPYDPAAQALRERLQGPSAGHLLGTDDLGRDVLSRAIFSARVSLTASVQAVAIATILGVPLGLLAGYLRGWLDEVASRVADAIMSIPAVLLAIAIIGVLGPDLTNAMIAIGLVYAPRFYRVVRGSTLAVREETYIESARSVGCSTPTILRRHVLPNVAGPLIVELSLAMGFALLAEAAVSFLGLGVQPPDASWGAMLGRATRFMVDAPTLAIVPGVLILLTILSFNTVGDGIADAIGRARSGSA